MITVMKYNKCGKKKDYKKMPVLLSGNIIVPGICAYRENNRLSEVLESVEWGRM